jgi:hypothetical protein
MANKNFWLGILVMVLVFGMAVVGCDDGSTDDNEDGGIFTLTNIPETYNGKYAYFGGESDNLLIIGCQSINGETKTLVKISNGKVDLPMWDLHKNPVSRFSGNGTLAKGNVGIFDETTIKDDDYWDKIIADIKFPYESLVFKDGNAEKSWNNGTVETY